MRRSNPARATRASGWGVTVLKGYHLLFLASLLPEPPVRAAATSSSYAILHQALDGGGGPAESDRYRAWGSFEASGGLVVTAGDGSSARLGFVGQVNDPPVARDIVVALPPDAPAVIRLDAFDPDLDPLDFRVVLRPFTGFLQGDPPDLVYTAARSFAGVDQFAFVASDGAADSASATVSVVSLNAPPRLEAIADRLLDEEQTLAVDLAATDPNVPPQSLTFGLEPGAPAGVTVDAVTGLLTWTPTEAQGPGEYSINVRVADNGVPSLIATRTFKVTVREANLPPRLTPIDDQTAYPGERLDFTARATDPDLPAQGLAFELTEAPVGAEIDRATGRFIWTPPAGELPGVHPIRVTVRDDGMPPAQATQAGWIRVVRRAASLQPLRRVGDAEWEVVVEGRPEACYAIQASTDLERWDMVAGGRTDSAGRLVFRERGWVAVPARYYRALEASCPPWGLGAPVLLADGGIHFEVRGALNACYRLEATTDLLTWTAVDVGRTDAAGRAVVTVPAAATTGFGFFRLQDWDCAGP